MRSRLANDMNCISRTTQTRLACAALAAPIVYSFIEPHLIQIREYEVALDGVPESADGLRIAHLSDLHCSAITSHKLVRRIVAMTNDLAPDLILMTGDYVSRRNSYLPISGARIWAQPLMTYAHRMAEEVRHLRAPGGVFAVLGNHDIADDNGPAITALLEGAGIRVLDNANTPVRGLPLCGVEDLRAGKPDLPRAFAGVAPETPQIILSHNPRILSVLEDRNALVLAGHTHAGQVHLPVTHYRRRPSDMRHSPYFQGWYRSGRAQMYVHSGLGSVHFPVRLRCPPEIAIFTLRPKEPRCVGRP